MATFGFVTVDKTSGSGNGTVNISVPANNGNISRSKGLKVKNSDGTIVRDLTVIQAAGVDKVTDFSVDQETIPADGGARTFTVKGNAQTLYLVIMVAPPRGAQEVKDPSTMIQLPTGWTASKTTAEIGGATIGMVQIDTGKDGASASYSKTFAVNFPAAEMAGTHQWAVAISAKKPSGEDLTGMIDLQLTQNGAASLTITPSMIMMEETADTGTITITSNDAWIVEQVDGEEEPEPELTKLPTPKLNALNFTPKSAQLTISNAGQSGGVNNIEIILSPDHGSLSSAAGGMIWNLKDLTPSTQYVAKARFKGDGATTLDSEWATVTFMTKAEQGSEEPGDTGDISVYGFQDVTNDSAFTKGSAIDLSASKLNGLDMNNIAFIVELITKSRILNIASSDFSVFEAGSLPYANASSSESYASAIEAGQDLSTVSVADMVQMSGSYDSTSASLTIPDTLQPDSEGRFVVFVAFKSNHAWSSSTQNASITFETDNSEAVASITVE